MKIFSNFDTKLKSREYQKRLKEYGDGEVLMLSKSKLFYNVMVSFPIYFYLIFCGLILYFVNERFGANSFYYVSLPIIIILGFFILPRIIKYYMDYCMDFIIITPKQLIRYDQEGFLNRNFVSISVNSLKTISVYKKGLFYSIFNNGDIIFLSEGDVSHGEITLNYIHKPEEMKYKILNITKRN